MIDVDGIQNGLKNGEFFLEYLPTISLEKDRCVGGEALIRWRRESGVLFPAAFIPLIENTPLSGFITYWIIETVASELGDWLRANDDIGISINVPPETLGRGGLLYAAVKSGLSDLFPKIILEVTERGIPDQIGVDALNNAKGLGMRVALDDVGVGDANLVVLARIRLDMVKIDKAFVDRMHDEDWSQEENRGIAALLRAIPSAVIVEGVESAAQVDILKQAGFKLAQGWYFSPPLSARDFKAFYDTHQ